MPALHAKARATSHTVNIGSLGLRLSAWFEHWFSDAFSLACCGAVLVALASIGISNSPAHTQWFGAGFWDLVGFTIQVTMLIVSGYALAKAPPVESAIRRLATIPRTPGSPLAP